tara:strand:- start:9504 stop:9800 length:297 start_codon:yes stop_codon:yes gene_type:complete
MGSVTAHVPVTQSVTGVSAASATGSVTISLPRSVSVTGVSAASEVGSVQINFAFTVDGVSAEGSVNNALVWSVIDASQTSNFSEIDASQTPDWTEIAA